MKRFSVQRVDDVLQTAIARAAQSRERSAQRGPGYVPTVLSSQEVLDCLRVPSVGRAVYVAYDRVAEPKKCGITGNLKHQG